MPRWAIELATDDVRSLSTLNRFFTIHHNAKSKNRTALVRERGPLAGDSVAARGIALPGDGANGH
jgi:hypothetical protein